MFTDKDAREIFSQFPPSIDHSPVGLPSLVAASSGQGLITTHHVMAKFKRHMTEETKRIPLSNLANDIDVDPEFILELIHKSPALALLSDDGHNVVPKFERDAIREMLSETLSTRALLRKDYAAKSHIDPRSLNLLLNDVQEELVHYEDIVCTVTYNKKLREEALDYITRAISNIVVIDLRPSDLAQLHGSPPKWLVLHHLESILEASPEFVNDVFIKDIPEGIRIQSKHLREHTIQSWIHQMESNKAGYIDLQLVMTNGVCLYDTVSDVVLDFQKVPGLEIIDTFAISETWFEQLVEQKLKALHWEEMGTVDVANQLGEKFQFSDGEGHCSHRKFPESLYSHLGRKVEQHIAAAMTQSQNCDLHHFGTLVLTDERYILGREQLLEQAKENAASQWQYLKDDPSHEIKFDLSNSSGETPLERSIHSALSTEKATQKHTESQFWSSIAELETSNETAFATFWNERVDSRARIYNSGLSSISDPKLHGQLSELLASYVQKELVPESITKARSQHLILSRKTKKNVSKLEVALAASKSNAEAVLITIDKFNKKQGVESVLSADDVGEAKNGMVQDMLRRMQKQQKASDGPVLFLTLVVVLFAKHHVGVVYATGKYAPKLLKLLKGKLETGQYEKVEKWKEAAKSSSLTSEDREEMRMMAEA
ncbi:hypothetical protein GQ44DRAFT_770777 [Phaeosphaeriaceae sp. PMI808]|nr:hypothetical protein GQ44DRAFT_770777 [Phaeosphaeriaceae sp. PMI808]